MLWRSHLALSDLHQATARPRDARHELLAARTIAEKLAGNIPDADLRNSFLARGLNPKYRRKIEFAIPAGNS